MIQSLYQLPMGSFFVHFHNKKNKGISKVSTKTIKHLKIRTFSNSLKISSSIFVIKEGISTSITNYIYRGINFAHTKKQILEISRRKAWRKYEIQFTVVQLVHIGWDSAHSCGWAMSLSPTKRRLRFVARG